MGVLCRKSFTETSLLCFGSESYQSQKRGASASKAGTLQRLHRFPTYTPTLMPPSALILDVFLFQADIQRVSRVCFHSWKPLDLSGEREKALCRNLSDWFSETLVDVFIDKSTQNREGNWKPRVRLSSLGSRLCSDVGDKT